MTDDKKRDDPHDKIMSPEWYEKRGFEYRDPPGSGIARLFIVSVVLWSVIVAAVWWLI